MNDERKYSVLASVMLGGIMGPIDASIVNVILPTITQFFSVPISTAQWVPMVYILTMSSLLLFYGRLGDILGYKRVYLIGLASFIITSGLCGLSPTIYWLILLRGLQGLAAGIMASVPYAIITGSFPAEERGKALGINAISISAGLAIGPSLGGFVTSLSSWRLVFLINIPIGVAGLLWAHHILPEMKGQPGKMDAPGALAAFISGLNDIVVILLLVAGMAGVSFFWIERRSPQPMVNLSLFGNLTFSLANLSALLNFMSQYVMVFLTPFYLHRVLQYTPKEVGLIMTSFPLAVMAVAPFSGSLSDRIGTKYLACFGAALCALSLFLMSRLQASVSSFAIVWRLALFGLGTGIFQSPNNSAAMGSVPRPYLGIASGILATGRNLGMVLGISTAGAVLYAFVPTSVLQKATLDSFEVLFFLSGLKYAYIAGGIATLSAAVIACLSSDADHPQDEIRMS